MDDHSHLASLEGKPFATRLRGYWRLTGPGYLQSAMTLGGGTISSCVLLGSLAGYDLLWVQPLAITLGVLTLAAVAKQTLNSGDRPYAVFWERLHPGLAIAWAGAAFIATILWHIPQYGLTANGFIVVAEAVHLPLDNTPGRIAIGVGTLCAAIVIVRLYQSGASGLRLYERAVKVLVWSIILAFGVAAFASGIDFVRLFQGYTGISFLQHWRAGVIPGTAIEPVVAGIAAAVGINMIFLYPYSLLNKGWGKRHTEMAYFDLVSGMLIPFLFATTLMIVAVANTIGPAPGASGVGVRDMREVLPVLDGILGNGLARLVIGAGMFAVGFSTIITHMLACGFIGCELFNLPHNSRAKWWFSLAPAIGVVGVYIKFPFAAAVTASILAAPLLPVAVVGFLILMNSPGYMGKAMPRGGRRLAWNAVLATSIVVMSIGAYVSIKPKIVDILGMLRSQPVAAAVIKAEEEPPARLYAEHAAMGTRFALTLVAPSSAFGPEEMRPAAETAWQDLDALENRISNWRPDSEVSRLNRTAAAGPVSVGGDILAMLLYAKGLHAETGGLFDPTVGPLLEAWGFYRKEGRLPSDTELAAALRCVGMDKVRVDADAATVAFDTDCLRLDFGGMGKGLALDRIAGPLRDAGYRNALLDAGTSTVLAMGAPPGAAGWTVDIRNPYTGDHAPVDRVVLRDEALSTSALYENYLELDGRRVGHILDPASGQPIGNEVLSATAIAPTGLESDALSTAFFALGLEGARAYCAAHPAVRAILIIEDNGRPRTVRVNFTPNEESA